MTVLAGDVGGTNARLALVEVDGRGVRIVREGRFPSKAYAGLAPIIRRFCDEAGMRPKRACFATACPVVGDECRAPNLPWTLNARQLARDTAIPHTALINDFEAVGYGIAWLGPSDLAALQTGELDPHGPIALIGAGTGLGEGFLLWDGRRYRVYASEGGHADFAATDEKQFGLVQYLRKLFGHVSRERVLSGPGIVHIYRHLASAQAAPEQPVVREEMKRDDPAAVITRHALAGTDALCARVLDLFVKALGAEAGNLALGVVATGGVYVAGGIAPRIVEKLKDDAFITAFREKGRMSDILRKIPVYVILNTNVGLLGAAVVAAALGD